jgi:hypothetical protein
MKWDVVYDKPDENSVLRWSTRRTPDGELVRIEEHEFNMLVVRPTLADAKPLADAKRHGRNEWTITVYATDKVDRERYRMVTGKDYAITVMLAEVDKSVLLGNAIEREKALIERDQDG